MAMKQQDANWFRPLWRRVALTAFLALWLAWEALWNQDQFWSLLVGAALAYSLYNFFYAFPKEEQADEQVSPPPPADGEDRQDS